MVSNQRGQADHRGGRHGGMGLCRRAGRGSRGSGRGARTGTGDGGATCQRKRTRPTVEIAWRIIENLTGASGSIPGGENIASGAGGSGTQFGEGWTLTVGYSDWTNGAQLCYVDGGSLGGGTGSGRWDVYPTGRNDKD